MTRYVPLGLSSWFRGQRVHSVTELDWWQTHDHAGSGATDCNLQVTLVPAQVRMDTCFTMITKGCSAQPRWNVSKCETHHQHCFANAQHWSTRTAWDKCRSLWGGYVLSMAKQRFYFAGDTGYCTVFKEIGRRFGPIALAAIPIGAYEPRWCVQQLLLSLLLWWW